MSEGKTEERYRAAVDRFQAARTREDHERSLAELDDLVPELSGVPHVTAALLKGKCMQALGDFAGASSVLRLVVDALTLSEDAAPEAALLCGARLALAEVLQASGRGREAIDVFVAAVPYFRHHNDTMSEANVHQTVGLLWQELGDHNRALESLESARKLLANEKPTSSLQHTLYALGHTHYLAGNVSRAIEFEEQALDLARTFQDQDVVAELVHNLAEFAFKVQDFRRAIKYISISLSAARKSQDETEVIQYLSYLGSCYTETGACRQALAAYDEVERLLTDKGQKHSVIYATARLGRAQVLVDMKRYAEATSLLSNAKALLTSQGIETGLFGNIQRRLERESAGPLTIDCAHRALQVALKGTTLGLSHTNPRPIINLSDERFLTSELSAEDRITFRKLGEELGRDYLQTKHSPSGSRDLPGGLLLPLKIEYVDDVAAFEVKWHAFKEEQWQARVRASLQENWDKAKSRIKFVQGPFKGDKLALLDYVSQLARIAQVYADIGDEDGVRRVALHASDYIEIQTNDPMIAAALWSIRAQLFVAAHCVSAASARELIETEIRRCLDREREVFEHLDVHRRDVALSTFVVHVWYEVARNVLGREGYAHLVEIVGDGFERLEPLDRMRYGVAVGRSVNAARGTRLMDAVVIGLMQENPGVRIDLSSDFECARATVRFRAECPDWSACRERFGPFAHYIHAEVRSWDEDVFVDVPEAPPVFLGSQSIQAFVDENLVVMANAVAHGASFAAAAIHEAQHRLFRSGQHLTTDDGRWLPVRRDVPTASANTYLALLEHQGEAQAAPLDPALVELLKLGRSWATQNPRRAERQIENMLRHFDDLLTQETPASYPCAAILIGMAQVLYGEEQVGRVRSYVSHLAIMDHEEALEFGRREASLFL